MKNALRILCCHFLVLMLAITILYACVHRDELISCCKRMKCKMKHCLPCDCD